MSTDTRHRFTRLLLACVLTLALVRSVAASEPPLRFGPEFPVSAAMEERIRFWIRIFTAVSRNEILLHDRDDLRLIYDVLPIGAAHPTALAEAARRRYDGTLTVLAISDAVGPLDFISPERMRIRAVAADRGAGIFYARAAGNVRAQRGMRETFAEGIVRSDAYLPTIQRTFKDGKLPPELVYLPHVESSFNAQAMSRAGAVGLWQLGRETARNLLRVDGPVDERLDPVRSTAAAAKHLKRARDVLGSWPLAITSYNHGVAGIVRARSAVGTDSLDDIIRGYDGPTFRFASQNFYAEFLAAVHVARYARHYFPDIRRVPVQQYVVRSGDSLWTIARRHRVTVRDLQAANNLKETRLRTGQMILIKQS
jgi:membrane-bound lytic murein transglycosylase D